MPTPISRAARLLCAALALALLAAPANAADAPFTPRFATTVHGNVAAVGNTLMTCQASAACTTAQNGTAVGSALNNNSYTMVPVNSDADVATTSSSSATLALPGGATVVWAGLYWGADTSAGAFGVAAPNAAANGTIDFRVPGGSYQPLSAASGDVLTSSVQATRYRAFRDVTALVAAAGAGTYWAGDIQAGTGWDRFAGWALIVAYRDDAQATRRLNVYDGLGTVDQFHTFQTTIAPFHTPATGTVTTKVGLLSFEGDAGIASETAAFNGQALSDLLNPLGNALNSSIESGGTRFAAKSPDYVNQLGTDLDVFTNGGNLANDQSSAALAFSSASEYFMPSAFFLVSDEGPATSTGAGPAVSAPAGGAAQVGETLSADPGSWNGTGPLTYTYQWQRCDANGANCADIPGATGSTYTPGPADAGGTVRVVVTVTNAAGTSTPVASAPIAVAALPPVNTGAPVLSGPAAQGQTLTAGNGTWSGTGPAYDYQWQRCDASGANCTDIPGATGATYTPTAEDAGGRLRVVVTATNDAGSTVAVSAPSAVVPAAADADLGSVPGSLVAETSCQQLVGGAKYRRVALGGIGTVRVRAYTSGPARESSPVRLSTEVTGGRAKSVRYTIDGRAVAAARGSRHPATLTPAQLGKVGAHTLRTAVRGRRGAAKSVALKLMTAPCQTLFTAQRWRTSAGAGLRLRVDARTALTGLTFTVPAALLPKQATAKRAAGFIRLYVAGRRTPLRVDLSLPKRGKKALLLGAPAVTRTRRGLVVSGLPAGTAVAELTLYRVTKLDAATPARVVAVKATVTRAGAPAQAFSARPKLSR